jgi:hypothetical protein
MYKNQHTGNAGARVPSTNRDLLEQSRLSRMTPREPFRLSFDNTPTAITVSTVCAGCYRKFDADDPIQSKFSSCLACIGISGRVEAAAEANDKRARRELLEKMAGGAR